MREQAKNLPEKDRLLFEAANPLVEDVDAPHELEHLLAAFFELNSGRGSNGFGPSPLTFTEIESWTRLRQFPLTAWEVDVIKKLDAVFLEDHAKKAKSKQQPKSK